MKTRAAILRERNQPWSVEEIELDPPKAGEVLVKLAASGLCHSDEHVLTGDLAGAAPEPPMIGGHEGSGVVLEVGEGGQVNIETAPVEGRLQGVGIIAKQGYIDHGRHRTGTGPPVRLVTRIGPIYWLRASLIASVSSGLNCSVPRPPLIIFV